MLTQADRQTEIAGLVKSVEDFCQRVQTGLQKATFEQKRQLVELLIDRVIVNDGDVEIHYVIPLTPESEQVRFCHLRSDYFRDPFFIGLTGGKVALHVTRSANAPGHPLGCPHELTPRNVNLRPTMVLPHF